MPPGRPRRCRGVQPLPPAPAPAAHASLQKGSFGEEQRLSQSRGEERSGPGPSLLAAVVLGLNQGRPTGHRDFSQMQSGVLTPSRGRDSFLRPAPHPTDPGSHPLSVPLSVLRPSLCDLIFPLSPSGPSFLPLPPCSQPVPPEAWSPAWSIPSELPVPQGCFSPGPCPVQCHPPWHHDSFWSGCQ